MKRSPIRRKVRPTVVLRCEDCGQLFRRRADVPASQAEDGKIRCNSCARKQSGRTRTVEKPTRRKYEKTGRYKGQPDKERTRRAVKARDGDACLLCRRPGPGLHLHRVVYGSQGGRYVEGNCVLLCLAHHAVVHGLGRSEGDPTAREWQAEILRHLADSYYALATRTEHGGKR